MLGIYCRTSKERDIITSTILQQRTAGIKFAEKHNLEYVLYEEEKSASKNPDDELDPFRDRPEFASLINDIRNRKITQVWVWETSRLSRNTYASAFIFNVFEKFKIKLFENQKEYELTDPQIKMTRVILGAVAEYERHLIINRTSRGQKKQFEEGRKVHQKLYCYENVGKDKNGYAIWKPVESEIETYRYILRRYKEGASLTKIVFEVYEMNKIEKSLYGSYAARMGTVLRKHQYTGYQLNEEGVELYKRFRKHEINSIQILKDRKYWIKSVPYPLELITIEEWISIAESLQIRGSKMNLTKKERLLKASKDIGTGIITCGDCGSRFYYKEQKTRIYKAGHRNYYYTYFHNQGFRPKACNQFPRSFKIGHINEIMKLAYFFFYLVFDDTNELMNESQRLIRHRQIKVKEEINKVEKTIEKTGKRIDKFQTALERTDDLEIINVLAKSISQSEQKIEEQSVTLSKLKIEYEKLAEKFSQNLLDMTFYDVKEKINDWFFKLGIEEQRNELIKMIDKCVIFNHHLIIDTGKLLFLFDIDQHYVFDMKLLENLNKGEVYKKYFTKNENKRKAKTFNDKLILEVNLNLKGDTKIRVLEYMAQKFGFGYNLIGKTKLISFVSLAGIQSLEIKMPD